MQPEKTRKLLSVDHSRRRWRLRAAFAGLALVFVLAAALPAAAQDTTGQEGAGTSLTIADDLLDRSFAAYDAQEYDRALLDISLFVLLNPTATQGYYVRALVQLARDETDAALADLGRALTLADGDLYGVDYRAGLLATRANILQGTGDIEGALADYGQSIDIAPTVDSYAGRALLLSTQGEFDAALADVDAAIALTPPEQVSGLFLFRAGINNRAGDTDAATLDYTQYIRSIGADFQNADPITSDEVREYDMVPGRVYAIPFQATAGDVFSAAAAPDETATVDPLLLLITTEGEPLIANDDRTPDDLRAQISDFAIPTSGTYVLLVTHAGGGDTGRVRVVINLQAAP